MGKGQPFPNRRMSASRADESPTPANILNNPRLAAIPTGVLSLLLSQRPFLRCKSLEMKKVEARGIEPLS